MAEIKRINTSDLKTLSKELEVGQKILLSGVIYTARDAAHKRFDALLNEGKSLPFEINGAVIYYAGPTPAPEGKAVGACGPTTSGRMDRFAPRLLDMGLAAMIGKGERSDEVKAAIKRNKAVYLCATGGAGALASRCIKSCDVIAFEELGCESVKRMEIEDFPLVVANDALGNDLFESGRKAFGNDAV